jgi:hypothetical protein
MGSRWMALIDGEERGESQAKLARNEKTKIGADSCKRLKIVINRRRSQAGLNLCKRAPPVYSIAVARPTMNSSIV